MTIKKFLGSLFNKKESPKKESVNQGESIQTETNQKPADNQGEKEKGEYTKNESCKVKKITVHHLIVLDESGSMSCVTHHTINGCNETIQTIRQMKAENMETQEHYVSIYLFSTNRNRYIVYRQPVSVVKEITERDYIPGACTPMFDALGLTLNDMIQCMSQSDTIGYVTIITDGMENASRQFNLNMVRALITELKQKNVIFSFIGANIDAEDYAQHLNIENWLQFDQDDAGTREMWNTERRSKMRSNAQMNFESKYGTVDTQVNFCCAQNAGSYYKYEVPKERVTPDYIDNLMKNEIFVFGSNIAGKHRSGAAKKAVTSFGAVEGQGEGRQGQSYAIPTVGVSEGEIYLAIKRFCDYAAEHQNLTFYVTPVGCGLAGYKPYHIAPMFKEATRLKNVRLPKSFWDYNVMSNVF